MLPSMAHHDMWKDEVSRIVKIPTHYKMCRESSRSDKEIKKAATFFCNCQLYYK